MTKKLKSIFLTLSMVALAGLPTLALPSMASASVDINGNLCSGTNFDLGGGNTDCQSNGGTNNLNSLLTKIINIFSAIVGVIAVVMIIVGGLRYITSGGDSGRVSTAKTTIIYALVGLVIVALAQLIVHFVLNQSQGLTG